MGNIKNIIQEEIKNIIQENNYKGTIRYLPNKNKAYYFTDGDVYWKANYKQFMDIFEKGSKTGFLDLNGLGQLKRKPKNVSDYSKTYNIFSYDKDDIEDELSVQKYGYRKDQFMLQPNEEPYGFYPKQF